MAGGESARETCVERRKPTVTCDSCYGRNLLFSCAFAPCCIIFSGLPGHVCMSTSKKIKSFIRTSKNCQQQPPTYTHKWPGCGVGVELGRREREGGGVEFKNHSKRKASHCRGCVLYVTQRKLLSSFIDRIKK